MSRDYSKSILKRVFDEAMVENIYRFSADIMSSDADIYIVMARKAACFIKFLQKCGLLVLDDRFITDRLLDVNLSSWKGKRVIIIDDVIVSGTTVYRVIERLNNAGVESVDVYVLGVTEDICNRTIFDYTDSQGNQKSYIHTPYVSLSEASCIQTCSNIVTSFLLDTSAYDVDFPRLLPIELTELAFRNLVNNPNWRSYDVAAAIQSQYDISNITIIPEDRVLKRFDELAGIPVSEMGFFKIRVFARKRSNKSKPYIVNAVPFYLFDSIEEQDVNQLFSSLFEEDLDKESLSPKCKIRILQYVFANKLLKIWLEDYKLMFNKSITTTDDLDAYKFVFPASFYTPMRNAIEKQAKADNLKKPECHLEKRVQLDADIKSEEVDNSAVIKTHLMNPFVKLYHETEIEARELVKKYGKDAFNNPEYQIKINRLNRGYSYRQLVGSLKNLPKGYDRNTMVSLFLDETIDVGIVVPIIEEQQGENGLVFSRAYRHGEDVPFGEEEEKKCAILLKRLQDDYGVQILSNWNVEKMLVLFLRIGLTNNLFSFTPGDQPLYKVNVCSYVHGNVTVVDSADPITHNPQLYLVHRTDAVWLVDKLIEKEIIVSSKDDKNKEKYTGIQDNINLEIDDSSRGKIEQISTTFGLLIDNHKNHITPSIDQWDLVMFSTCLYEKDIINAMAAELAITADRWTRLRRDFSTLKGDDLVAKYKQDNLYISVNSGKKKYLSFTSHEPENRIKQIKDEFASKKETRLYAEVWNTFWPSNIRWSKESIGETVDGIIANAGMLLIFYNITYRLLFACSASSREEQEQWLKEAKRIYWEEMYSDEAFTDKKFLQNILKMLQAIEDSFNKKEDLSSYEDTIVEGITRINNTRRFELIQKIELFIDRHGKPVPIDKWGTMIYLPLISAVSSPFYNSISRYLQNYSGDVQLLPVSESKHFGNGIWILLRARNDIKKNLASILDFITTYVTNNVYVFTDLVPGLYVNSSTVENTQYRYSQFWNYAKTVIEKGNHVIANTKIKNNINIVFSQAEVGLHNSNVSRSLPPKDWKLVSRTDTTILENVLLDIKPRISIFTRDKEMEKMEDLLKWYETQNEMNVFVSYAISYAEKPILDKIVNKLRENRINVYYYDDETVGTDMIEYMRKCGNSDFVLIIGSKDYLKKAIDVKEISSGVQFEDRIIAGIFQSDKRYRIIPLIFGDGTFADQIPAPYNTIKGIKLKDFMDDSIMLGVIEPLLKAYKKHVENGLS